MSPASRTVDSYANCVSDYNDDDDDDSMSTQRLGFEPRRLGGREE